MTALALSAPFDGFAVFTDDLVDRLAARRREVAALEAECTAMVAELIRRDAHDDLGYRSMVSLLVDRLGIAPGVARGMMRLAAALVDMPHTRAAFENGDIDHARARRLVQARDANPALFAEHEAALLDTITGLPMRHVGRALDYWAQQAALEITEHDATLRRRQRRLWISEVDGMVHIDGRFDRIAGQVLITALNSVTDPQNRSDNDGRTPAQRRADALVGICDNWLGHAELPVQRHGRPHLLVHVSLEALEGRAGRPCELDQAGVITPTQARRLACDAKVTRIITKGESQVLDVGRTTRVIPQAIRLAVIARDKGCVVCDAPARWCEIHHIQHWADGGDTSIDNTVLICDAHHDDTHDGTIDLNDHIHVGVTRRSDDSSPSAARVHTHERAWAVEREYRPRARLSPRRCRSS